MTNDRFYLGPDVVRWAPVSLADVQAAVNDGLLNEETHWLECKAMIEDHPNAKKELARDLASMAVDGGLLIVGVAEDSGRARLDGTDLSGLAERIELIARTRIDPPLMIQCRLLSEQDDAKRGVLLIEVPPSVDAPHMVDGRYYGRGDKTKFVMSDPQVERALQRRVKMQADALGLLHAAFAADPTFGNDLARNAHLFVVAEPDGARPDLAAKWLGNTDWKTALNALIFPLDSAPFSFGDTFSPDFNLLTYASRGRASGAALHSFVLPVHPASEDIREDAMIDLEVHDNGGLVLFCGRASDHSPEMGEDTSYIFELVVVGLVRRVVTLAGRLGESAGYNGSWTLAAGVTRTAGLSSWEIKKSGFYAGDALVSAGYEECTRARTAELIDHPGPVTERLTGRLLRSLGTSANTRVRKFLDDSAGV